MKRTKQLVGGILAVWGVVRWLPDTLESFEATAKYGKWLYMHIGGEHLSSLFWKAVIPLIGIGLIFSDTIQQYVAKKSQRREGEVRSPIEKLEDRQLHQQSKLWLEKRLSQEKMKVESAFLFGSVIYNHFATTDVDVIVVLQDAPNRASARAGQRVKDLRKEFANRFGHTLDVQLFLSREEEGLKAFLSKLNKYEKLTLR